MTKSPHETELIGALALHYDDLVAYIRRRFHGTQFARDVVHDVCLQLLEKPPSSRSSCRSRSCAALPSTAPSTGAAPI